jgi:hypothetical protein
VSEQELRTPDELAKAKAEVHANRLRTWPSRWRCLLLRLALGQQTFDYMLRSIKNDPRTPAARLVDVVVRQDAREVRTEADWIKTIAKMAYHLPSPDIERKSWWRRLWCAMDGHGGISNDHHCKRCGAKVTI